MPIYSRGDYVKVEFPDAATGIGEWTWLRVDRCDEQKQLLFGAPDSVPIESAFMDSRAQEANRVHEAVTPLRSLANFTPHRRLVVIHCVL